eukprot:scaffold773_cov218-Chaetoceros_neogracile.AAC.9
MVPFNVTGAPSDAKVHEGYWNAAVNAIGLDVGFEEQLLKSINDLDLEMIYVTGHSMGAACAQIFGTYLAAKNNDLKVRVVSFGQSKVGNRSFKTWTEDPKALDNLSVFRFVNRADIVPRLSGSAYTHSGHLFQI